MKRKYFQRNSIQFFFFLLDTRVCVLSVRLFSAFYCSVCERAGSGTVRKRKRAERGRKTELENKEIITNFVRPEPGENARRRGLLHRLRPHGGQHQLRANLRPAVPSRHLVSIFQQLFFFLCFISFYVSRVCLHTFHSRLALSVAPFAPLSPLTCFFFFWKTTGNNNVIFSFFVAQRSVGPDKCECEPGYGGATCNIGKSISSIRPSS